MTTEINPKSSTEQRIDQIIKVFLMLFVFGSPFSISVAQMGIMPALLLWLLKIIFLRKGNFYTTFIDKALLIYLLGILITSTFCEYPDVAFRKSGAIWQLLIVYALLDVVDIKFLKRLIIILFLSSLLTSLYGIYQYFYGWDIVRHQALTPNSPSSHFYNIIGGYDLHLTYGGYFMMISLLGLSLVLNHLKGSKLSLWYYIVGTFLITFTVYGASARSAWVGWIMGIIFFGFLKNKKVFLNILILLLTLGSIAYFFVPDFKYKADTFKNIRKSDSYRWQIWTAAIYTLKDHPFLGIGHGNFETYYQYYKTRYPQIFPRETKGHPHNDFLGIYLTSGLIGFIGYLYLWSILIFKVVKELKQTDEEGKNLLRGLISGVVAFLFAGLSQNYFTDCENSMLLWFFVGCIMVLYYNHKEKIFIKERIKDYRQGYKRRLKKAQENTHLIK